ncbi:unconventional myosin-Va isoform X4 [Octopus sinensis]|uniref:Unconventional myosin-Va isoform X4 n=1 Tax=Octopus sinensis TaxID=2607531 RepID=A0A7E6FFB5_9MOLL|nr:unconventional myosin-Va isoform X4 [Octopus sinensis]
MAGSSQCWLRGGEFSQQHLQQMQDEDVYHHYKNYFLNFSSDETVRLLYVEHAKIWIRDDTLVWREGELAEDYKGQKSLKVLVYDKGKATQEKTIEIKNKVDLPHLRDPNLIKDNDLTSLNYLNEPEVLHTLKVRFIDKNIFYTYCGIILVAINPYQDVDIYDETTLEIYRYQKILKNLDPHIYAVAAEAFNQMTRFKVNQSIIVSGESGAGKTVSAKHTMHYFARVGGSTETAIHDKVLASNPIMESFGNAKTIRNDNSSRFGKYIEIAFGSKNYIIGANMKTYLLEKSRVVFQAPFERNYHIFYQLCASASLKEIQPFKLAHQDKFNFTNLGESPDIKDVNDAEMFMKTRSAFAELGIPEDEQMKMYSVVASILHLGNIVFVSGDDDSQSSVSKKTPHFGIVCELLGLNAEEMAFWLCNRQIASASERIMKPMSKKEAGYGRDALAKFIYARVFDWIVAKINRNLLTHEDTQNFIGVLDIYGFETFRVNSFEQFCINYANERLQLQFNTHVFTLEQQEYRQEGLEWDEISHYDNTPCIDLIESSQGILALLDDECKMLNGSDANWCTSLLKKLAKAQCFEKPRTSQTSFTVCHFAEKVTYTCQGFMEKNMDSVSDLQVETLRKSTNPFVLELFQEKKLERKLSTLTEESYLNPPKKSKKHKQTVGSQFKESLNSLMKTLSDTNPHYVRCIKPNDEKKPFKFHHKRVVEQLRACGVLETIRISAAGFPARGTYDNIFYMFQQLLNLSDVNKSDPRESCEKLMKTYIEDPDKYRFGKTKILFRAGQLALLDKLLSDRRIKWSVMVQKQVRTFLCKRRFEKIRRSVSLLQIYGRGYIARLAFEERRRIHASIKIQACFRAFLVRKVFQEKKMAAIVVQRYARRVLAQRLFRKLVHDRNATILQTQIRAWMARRKFDKVRRGVVLLQSHVRRRAAKKVFKELKRKAKDTDELTLSNRRLCNKIIELSNQIKEKEHDLKHLRSNEANNKQFQDLYEKLSTEHDGCREIRLRLQDAESLVSELKGNLKQKTEELTVLMAEKKKMKLTYDEESKVLNEKNTTLNQKLLSAQSKIKDDEGKIEEYVQKIESLTAVDRQKDMDIEKAHHEKMMHDYEQLKQLYDNLRHEMTVLKQSHHRTPSDHSTISFESAEEEVPPAEVEEDEEQLAANIVAEVVAEQDDKEDQGYGTSRRSDRPVPAERKTRPIQRQPTLDEPEKEDISLLLKLQNHIKDLEKENKRLVTERERLDEENKDKGNTVYNTLKMQELENDNDRMKREIGNLMNALSKTPKYEEGTTEAGKAFKNQYDTMVEELDRRRSEILFIKSIWLGDNIEKKDEVHNKPRGGEELSEEEELKTAFEFHQKLNRPDNTSAPPPPSPQQQQQEVNNGDVCCTHHNHDCEAELNDFTQQIRLLENQLQESEKKSKHLEQDLRQQIEELSKENDRQKQVISQNLSSKTGDEISVTMGQDIIRITTENLELRETVSKQTEQIRKLKKTLKVYARKLKAGEGPFRRFQSLVSATSLSPTSAAEIAAELDRDEQEESGVMAAVKHQEREYLGMLEYNKTDETALIKNLVFDLQPYVAESMLPGLPAYIIFMCIRHTDHINEDEKVCSLLTGVVNGIKRVVKKNTNDIERVTLWLANCCRLLHNLKQYSGEKRYQNTNNPKQNEHCLRNFDLSEYRPVFNDLCVYNYRQLIKVMKENLDKLIVPAILEHEAIAGLNKEDRRGRIPNNEVEPDALDNLQKIMSKYIRILRNHAVDPEVIVLIVKQLFYDMNVKALNNLLLRRDMCNWHKGTQIRYNISHLEQWLREYHLQDSGAFSTMEPLIQASQLLQARKTDADVDSVCQMCPKLKTAQIVKILNQYTPVRGYEDDTVAISFIRKVQEKLAESRQNDTGTNLLMDTQYSFPVTFPFNPSNIALERVTVPDKLHLAFLKRV